VNRPFRILAVTVGLIVAGAVLGATAGALALAIALTLTEGQVYGLEFAGAFGAVLGAVTAPVVALVLLRRVPLGRMFVGLTSGTVVGGVFGWIVAVVPDQVGSALLSAFVGCLAAAVSMRGTTRTRTAHPA
jgi:hypothetical protein